MDNKSGSFGLSDSQIKTRMMHRLSADGVSIEGHSSVETRLREGWSLLALRRYSQALRVFEDAASIEPDLPEIWVAIGYILSSCGRFTNGLAAYDRAIALQPDLSHAWLGRGHVLSQAGRPEEAFAAYDRALRVKPQCDYAPAYRLLTKLLLCDWDNLENDLERFQNSLRNGQGCNVPFVSIAIARSAVDQLQCARQYIRKIPSYEPLWQGQVYVHDRIRVAYLSADFHQSAMASLLAGVFERHDKSRFQITAVSFGPDQRSPMRRRLENAFERFVDVRENSDEEIAGLLREMEIDIAVDLMGFTRNNRVEVLARRPAPIQVNYVGYPGTMGAEFIDYIIADSIVIPAHQCAHYTEKVIWLPTTYLGSEEHRGIGDLSETRQNHDLPPDAFVFCCFNASYKLTPAVFDVWMRLLKSNTKSVLWLIETDPETCSRLQHEAERRGVSRQRLIFAPRMSQSKHLARHQLADLFVDTLPCGAHTTASDALRVGVPVLTCLGDTFAGRVSASLLRAAGLNELVTHSLEEYESLAQVLSHSPHILRNMRDKLLRGKAIASLFDTTLRTREIERAYEVMWKEHLRTSSGAAATPVPIQVAL